jgi:hypothetical protein
MNGDGAEASALCSAPEQMHSITPLSSSLGGPEQATSASAQFSPESCKSQTRSKLLRIMVALERLVARISHSTRRIDPNQVNRQIGRILQKNQRAAARFTVSLKDNDSPAGFYLHIQRNAEFDNWAEVSEGAYLLRSNITDWSDEQLWKACIQLAQAEAAFRIQKDQLQVRPIWHQRADRVQAHILVCFLAFVLWKPWSCGNSVQAWATHRAPCGKKSPAFNPPTSSCQLQHTATSVYVSSLNLTLRKRCSSNASASFYPSACDSPSSTRPAPHR